MTHWGAFDVEVQGDRVVGVNPIDGDPDPSPIGQSLAGTLTDPCRIAHPAVRASYLELGPGKAPKSRGREPFVQVSWDTAEALVQAELERVIEQHGNAAIYGGSYGWASAGRFHHAQSQVHRFLDCIGGYTRSVDTYSLAAGEVILPHVLGDAWSYLVGPTSWDVIVEHTQCFVAFGGLPLKNAQVSSGGLARHEQKGFMQRAQRAGVEFINVSPIQADTADFLDATWVAARPNTDVAVMLGIAHTLVDRGLHNTDFLDQYCVGGEAFLAYVTGAQDGQPKSAAWAAEIAGIDADLIVSLAQKMAQKRTMISVSWSLTRQDHGEQPYWMAVALAAMLGQIGLPGGGVGFGYAAENKVGVAQSPFKLGSFPKLPHACDSFIPVARIADMLLHPGQWFDYNGSQYRYPDTRLIYWAGGNPFHHHQDLNRLHRAWQIPDTIVSHEIWWNSTARHADIVLPVTSALERNDLGGASGGTTLQAMHKAVEPHGEARNDFDIFSNLARRMGVEKQFTEGRDEQAWLEEIYRQTKDKAAIANVQMPTFEAFWADGSYTFPDPTKGHVMLGKFRADPVVNPLATPSGRIELRSATIAGFGYANCPGHPAWLAPSEWLGAPTVSAHPLHLISNQPKTRLHSQLDNGGTSRASKIVEKEPITIHGDDAAERGVASGDVVIVSNDRGAFLAGAVVSNEIRRGVVQIATGAWWDPEHDDSPAPLCRHGNPNAVTQDKGTSSLAQGPSALSCLVSVKRWEGDIPATRVFTPPDFV
ncbi:MAG: molybdopterin guanine dinucleotide-containing S/N-oxide reductase [Lysobacterales bacterium]